jgi:hypothetical protein
MDPGENGAILDAGGRWGTQLARQGRERAVGIRQWRRLDVLKMLEGTGDGLGTTSRHPYAQSTYYMCIMCNNLSYP